MFSYTLIITIYAISVTVHLLLQMLRTRQQLIYAMVWSLSSMTVGQLAKQANCSKFRAWIFLISLRIRHNGKKSDPIHEGNFIKHWGYRLTNKGAAKYCLNP